MIDQGAKSYIKPAMDRGGYIEIGAPSGPAPVAPLEVPASQIQSPNVLAEDVNQVVPTSGSLAVGSELAVNDIPDVAGVKAALVRAITERRSLFQGSLYAQDGRYFAALGRVSALRERLAQLTDGPKSEEIYHRLIATPPAADQQ